ncbi:MAG TPA: hypothetical protein VKB65_12525 [Myxococcota bacterium]|nr:hypothetical protein [Myxococcota bacterium]
MDRAGRLLWEYWSPDVRREGAREARATLYRFSRIDPGKLPAPGDGASSAPRTALVR